MRMLIMSFVFFKQKTAYAIRISDWSSDVRSSDLSAAGATPAHGTSQCHLRAGRSAPAVEGDRADRQWSWPARVVATLSRTERPRSEERRGGNECVSPCRHRWSTDH